VSFARNRSNKPSALSLQHDCVVWLNFPAQRLKRIKFGVSSEPMDAAPNALFYEGVDADWPSSRRAHEANRSACWC